MMILLFGCRGTTTANLYPRMHEECMKYKCYASASNGALLTKSCQEEN